MGELLKEARKRHGGTPPAAVAKVAPTTPGPRAGARPPMNLDGGITLADLIATDMPEPVFLIGGLLPTGLSVLAARPKLGKSWLALQGAIAVSLGVPCLGNRPTRQADVLYLALEDTRRRLKSRAQQILAAMRWQPGRRLDLRVSWPRAGAGGLAMLAEWFAAHPGGFVIVDTLAKFRDPAGSGNAYAADYQAVAELKGLADQYGATVLVIHHTRKTVADDPFDEVSGTLGINGAADSVLVLDRGRGGDTGALFTTGRDLAEQTFALSWDAAGGLWAVTSSGDGITRPERPRAAGKPDQCAAWLAGFLGEHAWPDGEILDAAKLAGFTEDNTKEAKARLRKADPPLCSRPRGRRGEWWCWIGSKDGPRPDRPVNLMPRAPESPESYPDASKTLGEQGIQDSGGLFGDASRDYPRDSRVLTLSLKSGESGEDSGAAAPGGLPSLKHPSSDGVLRCAAQDSGDSGARPPGYVEGVIE